MSFNRRDFIKLAAAGSLTILGDTARASEKKAAVDTDLAFGVLVDTVVCSGCRKCEWACNDANSLSNQPLAAFEDKSVFVRHRRPNASAYTVVNQFAGTGAIDKKYNIKVQCMHCNDPACVSACIVGALRKDSRGPVTYDAWKCIGCRYCMVACPFQIPGYEYANALNPQVRKCTFCLNKVDAGEKPACIGICPNEALTFGNRRELIDLAHSRIAASPEKYFDHVYGEKEAGGTSWMYLAGVDFAATELPQLGDEPLPHSTEPIQHGIFKSFVPPLALYGLLGLAMYSFRHRDEGKAGEE